MTDEIRRVQAATDYVKHAIRTRADGRRYIPVFLVLEKKLKELNGDDDVMKRIFAS